MKIIKQFFGLFIFALLTPVFLNAQSGENFTLTDEALKGDRPVELGKLTWKYRAGDDAAWAARDADDAAWETVQGANVKPELLSRPDWRGLAWFRLRFRIEEKLVGQNIVLSMTQRGASEIFVDGKLLAKFGEIKQGSVVEYNPNRLPLPFRLDDAGEHSIAVRFASSTFGEMSGARARWLANGGIYPGISPAFLDGSDLKQSIGGYADYSSMRIGFLFIGFLLALALLHFLLYVFYSVERANLFYSLYAGAFAFFLFFNNFAYFGHQGTMIRISYTIFVTAMFALMFVGLLAFMSVAFGRRLGKVFWALTVLWMVTIAIRIVFLDKIGNLSFLTNILIGLSFTFCFLPLVQALREKRPGAWILMGGLQVLSLSMFMNLISQFGWLILPGLFYELNEIALGLAVPIAVSVYLARNFARVNRGLTAQLEQVKELSQHKIEQERQAAELRAENERRAKELEEARQLQLSMLPKNLPQVSNVEIAAYMKPATEVGGDYYDFHVGEDGTLTVAVGDATGHGLKAGTVVTAAKTLFRNYADEANIPFIFKKSSRVIKEMNLRGLFMAMTMLKIKDNGVVVCTAGMPSMLIFRAAENLVEEIGIPAMPLGSFSNFTYQQQEFTFSGGDTLVLMSDGFPEMFDESDNMLGYERAADLLKKVANQSPQEIINNFVGVGENWAGKRPQDDDVTFVVMKIK